MHKNFEALEKCPANYVPLSPISFLNRAAEVFATDTAVVHGDIRRNWRDTADRIRRVAGALAARGVGLGDTVSVIAPNIPALFELHYSVPMAGGVLGAINTRLEAETIGYILEHSDSKLVIVDTQFRDLVDEAMAGVGLSLDVIEIADEGPEPRGETYEDLTRAEPLTGECLPADEWQAIAINYTSGTSGRPKGVVYHHRGAYLMGLGTAAAWPMGYQASYLAVVPMFHCNGWCHPWTVPINGGKFVFTRNPEPKRLFEAIAAERVTHFGGAPIVLQMMAESDDRPDKPFDPPINVFTAGAPPPPVILEKAQTMGMNVMHVYGLTETYGHATQCLPQATWPELDEAGLSEMRGRQGVSLPIMEPVEVYDRETGAPVPRDAKTQGEIAHRGNAVMKGYYKNPDATAEAFEGGVFWSGDAAVMYPDGYIKIKDRLKDVIISGGENVSSVEVEGVLYRHPDVQTAAVVAEPHEKWGEVPCAFIELRSGATATEEDIIAFCKERLAGFKTPKRVVFTEIPKTSTGKIQKFKLRETLGN
ncbi:MAG: AMP-binding protein [Silicimonas sp.]|nr:AMP-binding protein [Silicimonas sp.]